MRVLGFTFIKFSLRVNSYFPAKILHNVQVCCGVSLYFVLPLLYDIVNVTYICDLNS